MTPADTERAELLDLLDLLPVDIEILIFEMIHAAYTGRLSCDEIGAAIEAIQAGADKTETLENLVHLANQRLSGCDADIEPTNEPVAEEVERQHHTVPTITVGWLRQWLKVYPDDFELSFGGLEFYRIKTRGENLAMVEFNQAVYLDEDGQVVIQQDFDHG